MRPSKLLTIAAMSAMLAAVETAAASDHLDGHEVLTDPETDITDMYVFPSPEQSGRLVLVMNIYPDAGSSRWFSHALEYRFRLRPVSISGTGLRAGFGVGANEVVFSCTFGSHKHSDGATTQSGSCQASGGEVGLSVNRASSDGDYSKSGLRVFAGLRLDPFFMDVPGIITSMKSGKLAFTGRNSAEGKNALSIVLEINTEKHLPDTNGMYGVVGEIRTRGGKPVVLDTFGRPEVTNVILSDPSFDDTNKTVDLRDLFNAYDPFGEPGPYAGPFRARLNANLTRLDSLDSRVDWPATDGGHPLTNLQFADFTVIDLSKPVGSGSWFEIERAIVEEREHKTGGGRWLDDDICDIQYAFLIARDRSAISDGVDAPTKPASKRFPYLRKPAE